MFSRFKNVYVASHSSGVSRYQRRFFFMKSELAFLDYEYFSGKIHKHVKPVKIT